jgi:hypothetical protein
MWAVDICRVGNGRTALDRGGDVKPDIEVLEEGRPLSGVVDDGRVGGRLEDATVFCDVDAGMKNELGLVGDAGCEGYTNSSMASRRVDYFFEKLKKVMKGLGVEDTTRGAWSISVFCPFLVERS